jgi:hypothetical protein
MSLHNTAPYAQTGTEEWLMKVARAESATGCNWASKAGEDGEQLHESSRS